MPPTSGHTIDMSDCPTKSVLQTKRLLLRPVTMDDLDDFHRIIASPGVHEGTLTFPVEPGAEWARARLQRVLEQNEQQQAYFIQAVNGVFDGDMVPVPGGVLIQDAGGALLGAVGISGDTSDNDEAAAIAGIEAAGLSAKVD